jgi:hypothetical protein
MNKNILLGIVIILLLIFNSVIAYKYNANKKELAIVNRFSELQVKENHNANSLKKAIMLQQLSEAIPCVDIEIKDAETQKTVFLHSLLEKDKPLLFFRFKESYCDACVEQSILLLTDMSKYFPENRILILSGYANVRQFYAYAQTYKKHFKVFNIDVLPIAAEDQDSPYFFVLTQDMKFQNIFIVNKEDIGLTSEYLHYMGHKYWSDYTHEH